MPQRNPVFRSCAVLLLTGILMLGAALLIGGGVLTASEALHRLHATPTATLVPLAALPVSESHDLPGPVTEQMDLIQQQVIQLRGMLPNRPLARALISPSDLRSKVLTEFLADYSPEEARRDQGTLTILGLLEPDIDLLALFRELYSEQVAGFYDNDKKEMYVVQGSGFGGQESSTYAHEYLHVLQDQKYDIANGLGYDHDRCELESERCLGIQALIEGDASVTEQEWLTRYASPQAREQIDEFYQGFSSPVYDSAPAFLKQDFLFPYSYGAEFVYSLRDRGGWEAVNRAYLDPPQSAEQILHPERYPHDKPQPVSLPQNIPALQSPWVEMDRGVLGEWYLYLMFAQGYLPEARQPESDARAAAEGWGGDAYAVYTNKTSGATAALVRIVFDTAGDAKEYADVLIAYATARWGDAAVNPQEISLFIGPGECAAFTLSGSEMNLVIAPDLDLAESLLKTLED